jgi:hypothetical protein
MELENQISNLRLPSEKTETQKTYKKLEPSSFQQLEINKEQALNPKILSVFQGDKNALQAPPNDIKLEESSNNDDKLNNIIVSIIYIYHINISI